MSSFSQKTSNTGIASTTLYKTAEQNQGSNLTNNTDTLTIKQIEQELSTLFKTYNQEFSFEVLQKEFGIEYSKENLLKCDKTTFCNLVEQLRLAFIKTEYQKENSTDCARTIDELFEKYASVKNSTISEAKIELEKINSDFDSILKGMRQFGIRLEQ